MRFEKVVKNGRHISVKSTTFNGPISQLIGAGAALTGVIILSLALLFFGSLEIGALKTKNYQPIEVTITSNPNEFDEVDITYQVNNENYNTKVSAFEEYKKDDKATFYYNPNNPVEIIEAKNSSNPILIIFLIILIFAFSIRLKRRINNYLHYIDPSKYKYDDTEERTYENQSDLRYDDMSDGEHNNIYF
ncbi:MAG: hypothetical protein VZS44_02445 [Bacilli bacterium]|nr:hypothetical protein [Bacilli bacterium]